MCEFKWNSRGPVHLQEAAVYVEHGDVVLSRVSGQDSSKKWHQQNTNASGNFQRSFQAKSTGGSGSRPEPMEIGTINKKPLTKEDYQKLRESKACFFCRKPNAGHIARDCPLK